MVLLMKTYLTLFILGLAGLWSVPAFAADTWTDPAPGIRQLVRTNGSPNRLVGVVVDISRPEYYIRATKPGERGRTTSSWAANVGAVVAINGDFFDGGYQPVGLAVGDGEYWEGTGDSAWSFMACTLEKTCTFDDWPTDTPRHHRFHDVVGGNGWRLLVDGNIPAYPADVFYTTRHPRSGVGVSQDGKSMIFGVVEGRRADSIGMGFAEFAQFFKDLGAHQALMLDGGGSTTLVVNGTRVNRLPSSQGSERVVANHLAIVRGTADARCSAVPNGRYCDGTVIHTCRGGEYRGSGDCGAFGAGCEVTTDGVGTCVHPSCTGGANGRYCEDETRITTCDYGAPGGTGDCAAFGATCETGPEDAYCVHFACTEGGNATWCRDDSVLATCADGQPQDDVDCSASGQVCREGACAPVVEPDGEVPQGEEPANPEDPVTDPEPTTSGGDPNTPGGPAAGGDEPANEEPSSMDGSVTEAGGKAGCSSARRGTAPSAGWLVLLIAIVAARRRP